MWQIALPPYAIFFIGSLGIYWKIPAFTDFSRYSRKGNQGVMGSDLGVWTPAFVLFFNAVWGFSTALWLNLAKKK